ncbi:unnamed protein product [Camellia sinensis]
MPELLSLLFSASSSIDHCSFASDVHNHDSFVSQLTQDSNAPVMVKMVELNAPFDPTKKKKKKKVVIQDPADDAVDNLAEKTESLSVSDGLESTFSGLKKKKKKSVHTDLLSDEKESVVDDLDDKNSRKPNVIMPKLWGVYYIFLKPQGDDYYEQPNLQLDFPPDLDALVAEYASLCWNSCRHKYFYSISDRAKVAMQGYLNHFLSKIDIVNSRKTN